MYTFTLHTKDMDLTSRFEIIKGLYDAFLYNDGEWHYFYEAEFGDFLRVSEEYSDRVEEWLKVEDVEYTLATSWIEDMEFVQLNKGYFQKLFHINSVFAVEYEGDLDYFRKMISYWIDRYSHSLHCMTHPMVGGGLMEKESMNLANATHARTWYDGYRAYYLQNKKYFKDEVKVP